VARRCRGEEGVSLILALAFLSLFGLFIPELLTLGSTNLLATSRLQEQRATVYAADGATDGAIQFLRRNTNCGRPINGSCPGNATNFTATIGPKSATTTWAFAGSNIDFDRTFNLTTTVDGTTRVRATVRIRDSNLSSSEVPVDVMSWTYVR